MQEITWWQWILILISVPLFITAIKFVVSFDIVKWREQKRERLKESLMVHCPHVEIVDMYTESRTAAVECLIISPPGTHTWYCNRCGQSFFDGEIGVQLQKFYGQNPKAYLNKLKKFNKIAKKLYG